MAASEFIDLLWPVFVLAGWEEVRIDPGNTAFTPLDFVRYPWSHSLLMVAVWAIGGAAVYWSVRRSRAGALAVGGCILSHWILDAVSHRPDLPLRPGGAVRVGLGLWNSVPVTLAIESLMFVAGVWIYARATGPKDRLGRYGLWVFVAVLAAIYSANAFGPPPPGSRAVAVTALGLWVFVLWAWRFDRHRFIRSTDIGASGAPRDSRSPATA